VKATSRAARPIPRWGILLLALLLAGCAAPSSPSPSSRSPTEPVQPDPNATVSPTAGENGTRVLPVSINATLRMNVLACATPINDTRKCVALPQGPDGPREILTPLHVSHARVTLSWTQTSRLTETLGLLLLNISKDEKTRVRLCDPVIGSSPLTLDCEPIPHEPGAGYALYVGRVDLLPASPVDAHAWANMDQPFSLQGALTSQEENDP
jgi:hypothetical protein